MLGRHKSSLGWKIGDSKRISPLVYTHKIFLKERAKPSRELQRRLNLIMQKVVINEILKLLEVGIIYPIFDSK